MHIVYVETQSMYWNFVIRVTYLLVCEEKLL